MKSYRTSHLTSRRERIIHEPIESVSFAVRQLGPYHAIETVAHDKNCGMDICSRVSAFYYALFTVLLRRLIQRNRFDLTLNGSNRGTIVYRYCSILVEVVFRFFNRVNRGTNQSLIDNGSKHHDRIQIGTLCNAWK